MQGNGTAVGCDGKEHMMNTTTTTTTRTSEKTTALLSVLGMAMLGLVILFAAGHAQSATLHDAAHDVRHATGFPCH
jgi:cobalt transporter subunit CbtB